MLIRQIVGTLLVTMVASAAFAPHLSAGQNEFRNLYFVAHQDDDLLFMNPDIQRSIAVGHTVKTVYLTAGDSCRPSDYWKDQREAGVKAAYARMAGADNRWMETDKSIREFTLLGRPNVSLVFFRLPSSAKEDGTICPHGKDLEELWLNHIQTISPLDDMNTTYTKQGLINALAALINEFHPHRINTLDSSGQTPLPCKPGNPARCKIYYTTAGYEYLYDHTDHYHSALFTQEACGSYSQPHELRRYRGYSSALERTENIRDSDFVLKQKAFEVYAEYDDTIRDDPPFSEFYDVWISRQYLVQ